MAASYVTSMDLTAEILTQRMPLSDAFNRATAAGVKLGVHHGLCMSYSDALWPHGNFSTQVLKLTAGKAILPAINTTDKCLDDVFLSIVLTADLLIDLEALTSPIISSDTTIYYLVLQVDYTQPTVNNNTGLVANIGGNVAKIYIVPRVAGSGFVGKGLVIGKFCRADKYVEIIGENPLTMSQVAMDDGSFGWLENVNARDKNRSLTQFKTTVNISQYANLRKHICFNGLSNLAPTGNNEEHIGSQIMPLADIATTPATAASDISAWTKPVDWDLGTVFDLYGAGGAGIWKDIEQFDLFNCYFKGAFRIAFHRTSGNGQLFALTKGNRTSSGFITPLNDYGSRQFIFDGKGSMFEGDVTIDLVLDFVGKAEDHIYRVLIRNLDVKGTLTINYGQSFLGQAGGAFGKITCENVQANGGVAVRPWPQVTGISPAATVPGGPYVGQPVAYFINNAQNVVFVGYTSTPNSLAYWQLKGGGLCWTKGVLIPIRFILTRTGAGAPGMAGNPYLEEAVDGGFIFTRSTIPTEISSNGLKNCPDASYKDEVRIKLSGCRVYTKGAVAVDGYRGAPVIGFTDDWSITLAEFLTGGGLTTGLYKKLVLLDNLQVANNIAAGNDISATRDVAATRNVNASNAVNAGTNVNATEDVNAGIDVNAARDVIAVRNVTAGTNVQAGNDSTAGRDVVAARNVNAGNAVNAGTSVNAAVDVNATRNVNATQDVNASIDVNATEDVNATLDVNATRDVAVGRILNWNGQLDSTNIAFTASIYDFAITGPRVLVLFLTGVAGVHIVTLPSAVLFPGRIIIIKKITTASLAQISAAAGSVEGGVFYNMGAGGRQQAIFISDGANWWAVSVL